MENGTRYATWRSRVRCDDRADDFVQCRARSSAPTHRSHATSMYPSPPHSGWFLAERIHRLPCVSMPKRRVACMPEPDRPSARDKQSVPVHRRTASSRCLLSANSISHPSGSHSSRRSGHVRCGCEESKEGVMPAQSLRILALLVAGVAPRLCWSLTTSIQHASGRLLHRSC